MKRTSNRKDAMIEIIPSRFDTSASLSFRTALRQRGVRLWPVFFDRLSRISIGVALCVLISGCATPRSAKEFAEPVSLVSRVGKERSCEATGPFAPAGSIRLEQHVLVSDSEGNIPKNRHDGSFSKAFRTIMAGYVEEFNRRKRLGNAMGKDSPPPRLLFYFNGGLNFQADVEAQAERQIPCMMADGYYPVFFVWDTGHIPSYWEQIWNVYDGQVRHEPWVKLRAPFLFGTHVISGFSGAPVDYLVEGRRFWRAVRGIPPCSMTVRNTPDYCPEEQRVRFVDQQGGADPNESTVYAAPSADLSEPEIGSLLGYSALFPVRLFSAPLAHGLGDATWENYLRRTRTTIRRTVEFDLDRYAPGRIHDGLNPDEFRKVNDSFTKGTGVFARFFETLLQYYKGKRRLCSEWFCDESRTLSPDRGDSGSSAEHKSDDDAIVSALANARITLIGHSMGAIVINELVERFPDLPYGDIVVMASAASLRDTRRVITNYFESPFTPFSESQGKPIDTRFYSLMLHPLNDAGESTGAGLIPSGSLLMWIDEMYEVPKTPEDKTFGYWPTAKAGRRMFGHAAQVRTLYRVFNRAEAASGEESNPVRHGDFNNDDMCFWRPAFWGVNGTGWESLYSDLPPEALQACRKKE